MTKSISEQYQEISRFIAHLYEHIHLGESPEGIPYSSGIQGTLFYLDDEGYQQNYYELISALLGLPDVRDIWSVHAIEEQLHWLLAELATSKVKRKEVISDIDFSLLVDQLLSRLQINFEKQEYIIPVKGLVLSEPLLVGDVTFWPLEEKLAEIQEYDRFDTHKNLRAHHACIASSRIAAELNKAGEILRFRVEETLNILRYLGAVVWYNQPTKHIYLAGTEPERVSYVLTSDSRGRMSRVGNTLYVPLPFQVGNFFTKAAEGYGILDFSRWLVDPSATPLQKLLLNSIQWFGDATQELNPLQAFMKYYIAIEILLKKEKESASKVLPKRGAYLSSKQDREKREKDFFALIGERNSVFHAGCPKQETPEALVEYGHQLARNVINRTRTTMIESRWIVKDTESGWRTKDELIDWIESELKKG